MASDSSDIDNAIVAKLGADATLLALVPNGIYWDVAPPGSTRFVIVSLADSHDEMMMGSPAWEDTLYLVKAVMLTTAGGDVKAAAARVHVVLQDATLAVAGYSTMTVHRESRIRMTEIDDVDDSIRWLHRGGYYRVMMST